MMHPDTRLQYVSQDIGNGVFAVKKIPKGTITAVKDACDQIFTDHEFSALPELIQESMNNHIYRDHCGNLVLSWDYAKYLNHSCCANTMLTCYNFEIAVHDILPGDEITAEYGLLNVPEPYDLFCRCPDCRGRLSLDDIDRYAEKWDALILGALLDIKKPPQPLWPLLNLNTACRLDDVLVNPSVYSSVRNLKWRENRKY